MFDEISKIKEVTKSGEWYSINLENSIGFGLETKYNYAPKVGDEIKLCTVQGSTIRGIFANGKQIFYKTDEELGQERKERLDNHEKEKQTKFIEQKDQLDKDYEELPHEFKDRIDRFRKNNPRFRIDFESYEMFCCKEAVKIAKYCQTAEEIENFKKLDWEEQKKAGVSDGHSGNTFGCALALAYWYVKEKSMVAKMHGAMAPLVGSEEYGEIEKVAAE
jgi:hypothetical protein